MPRSSFPGSSAPNRRSTRSTSVPSGPPPPADESTTSKWTRVISRRSTSRRRRAASGRPPTKAPSGRQSSRASPRTPSVASRSRPRIPTSSGPARANNNNRQSSSWGGGVYRSTDAGATWTHVGLDETREHRARHRTPDRPERRVRRRRRKSLEAQRRTRRLQDHRRRAHVGEGPLRRHAHGRDRPRHGPARSQRPLRRDVPAAAHRRSASTAAVPGARSTRPPTAARRGRRLENGIPAGDKGRIGLSISQSNPDVVVAPIEHATEGGTYRTDDAGATWKRMSGTNPRPMYYSKPSIDPTNDKRIWLLGTNIVKSEDGGATFEEQPTSPTYDVGLKTDHHTMWIDPRDPKPHPDRRRRRVERELRPGQDVRAREQHSGRPVLSHRRRRSRSVLDLRRPAGQPLVDGAERDAPLARHSQSGLGRRSDSATAPGRRWTRPTGARSTRRRAAATSRASIR